MNKKNKENKSTLKVIPRMARKLGEHTAEVACIWWLCQPKMPDSMKKQDKK